MKRRKFVTTTLLGSLAVSSASAHSFSNEVNSTCNFASRKRNLNSIPNYLNSEKSILRVADLDIGEEAVIKLSDRSQALIKVLDVIEQRESVTRMLTGGIVKAEINGEQADLICGPYRLPVMAG